MTDDKPISPSECMTDDTRKHFDAWCTREQVDDATRALMREHYATDPDRYDYRGWWYLWDEAQLARLARLQAEMQVELDAGELAREEQES